LLQEANVKDTLLRLGLALAASAGPAAFPLAQMGYAPLHRLAFLLILPSAGLLVALAAMPARQPIGRALRRGLVAGALATGALEAVRYTGFSLGFMPGNLPQLMGVLLLDRFALGPSWISNLAGFAYHFWNGAAFGAAFVMLPLGRARRWAIPFGVALGIGFLASPVVQSLGIGFFGRDFGWRFAATVLAAHAAYGAALGWLLDHDCGRTCARSSGLSTSNHAGPIATLNPHRRKAPIVSSSAEPVDQ
jgi:hypothetical protein